MYTSCLFLFHKPSTYVDSYDTNKKKGGQTDLTNPQIKDKRRIRSLSKKLYRGDPVSTPVPLHDRLHRPSLPPSKWTDCSCSEVSDKGLYMYGQQLARIEEIRCKWESLKVAPRARLKRERVLGEHKTATGSGSVDARAIRLVAGGSISSWGFFEGQGWSKNGARRSISWRAFTEVVSDDKGRPVSKVSGHQVRWPHRCAISPVIALPGHLHDGASHW